jgi:hypothetical protein
MPILSYTLKKRENPGWRRFSAGVPGTSETMTGLDNSQMMPIKQNDCER